ncbi:MAG: leucine-rich repeat domain-containing protein [Bacteroidaceae bacterium]|nr:leucine-rich repeat domain-containing protein [Bacteroidaceae bacterium]
MNKYNWTTIILLFFLLTDISAQSDSSMSVGGIYYSLDGNKAVVTNQKGVKYQGEIIIPATITYNGNTYTVTSIGQRAFEYCDSITKVVLPETITRIGFGAFNRCYGLSSITLPESLTLIESNAFLWCTGLKSIVIPESVDTIIPGAFFCCNGFPVIDGIRYADTYLIEVTDKHRERYTVREGTRWIEDNAFSNNYNLQTVILPSTIQSIGNFSFSECPNLSSINIPENVQLIGVQAFSFTNSLKNIVCRPSNPPLVSRLTDIVPYFECVDTEAITLYVPRKSLKLYSQSPVWSEFRKIRPIPRKWLQL